MPRLVATAAELNRWLSQAQRVCYERVSLQNKDAGHFGRGLSMEGYMGGYVAALNDVSLILSSGSPQDERGIWADALRQLKAKQKK